MTIENLNTLLTAHLDGYDITTPPDVMVDQQMRHPTGYLSSFGNVSINTCPIVPMQEFKAESPFATVLYPTPVTRTGKWMFEAIVSTPGIMQVGWTVPGCRWTDTDGVGDYFNSFGYDGKRLRLFMNKASKSYGMRWVSGDVIGCCIDFDGLSISYYCNGRPLGTLHPKLDKNLNYVPGVSISKNERVILNIGDFPFM